MKKFYINDNMCTPYKLILHKVSAFLEANGWQSEEDSKNADTVIVGTCGAFESLEQESYDIYNEHAREDSHNIIFGCLPRISPDKMKPLGADQIIDSTHWQRFEKMVDNPDVKMAEVATFTEFRMDEEYRRHDPGKQFVLTQTGCSSNCPFCPHKMGIGDLVSRTPEDILNQIKMLSERDDVHTVVLTGNDTGSYGTDIGTTFPELVTECLKYPIDLHLCQINPNWVHLYQDELAVLVRNPKVKDFQTLIQTPSSRLLEMMERLPIVREIKPWLADLRKDRPDLFMRTDIMIGYPTATDEEEFEAIEYVGELMDEVAVHAFEVFRHARIAKMGIEFYSQEEIDRRLDRALRALQRYPNLLVHRGGQVYQTLIDAEGPKEEMRNQKYA